MNNLTGQVSPNSSINEMLNDDVQIEELDEKLLLELHPQLVNAIKTIQAEKLGDEEIAWQDFSQHNKS